MLFLTSFYLFTLAHIFSKFARFNYREFERFNCTVTETDSDSLLTLKEAETGLDPKSAEAFFFKRGRFSCETIEFPNF